MPNLNRVVPRMRSALVAAALVALCASCALAAGVTEVWRIDRDPTEQSPANMPVMAGPVAYAPMVGDMPRFLAVVLGQRLIISDGSGREVWSLDLEGDAQGTLAVADVDRNGHAELLVALDDGVLCVRADGTIAWRRAVEDMIGSAVCANLIGDERLEVLAADGHGGLTCLGPDGRVLWHLLAENARRPVDKDPFISRFNWNFERYLNRDATCAPAAGDVDGDGAAEILFLTEPGYLYCLSGRGDWKWQFKAGAACYGAPVIADLDNDGSAEIIVGSDDRHLYILRGATGETLATVPTEWGVTPSIAAADLDDDGTAEIVFSDGRGVLYCCDATGGERWRLPFKPESRTSDHGDEAIAPPAIADVDGDGALELVFGMKRRELLYVISAGGGIEATHTLETGKSVLLADSGMTDTAVVADLDADGRLEIVAATRLFATCCLRAGGAADVQVAWAGARGTPELTGCAPERRGGATPSDLRRARGAQTGAVALSHDAALLVDGVLTAGVGRPADVPAVLLTTVRTTSGARELRIDQVLTEDDVFGIPLPVADNWPTGVQCVEVSVPDGRVMAAASADISLSAVSACKLVHEDALSMADLSIRQLHLNWPNKVALAAARAAAVPAGTGEPASPLDWARRDLRVAAELRALTGAVERQRSQSGTDALVTWAANPWDSFDPGSAWLDAESPVSAALAVSLYQGEYEAAAANLLNVSAQPLEVRVAAADLVAEDGTTLPAGEHLVLRETTMVPRHAGDRVGDALVSLGEAGIIRIAPMRAAQLWVTVRSGQAAPGLYEGRITLTEMTPDGKSAVVPLRVRVWPIALPEKSPVRFCTWAYLDNSAFADRIDAAMADLVAHKNTVFTVSGGVTIPYDDTGEVLEPDWDALDTQLDRYAGHGIILINEPGLKFVGQGAAPPEAEQGAHTRALRLLATHLAEKGLDYSDWAIYVTDEPGLEHGPRIEYLIEHGRRIKAADPRIRNYTDPIVVMSREDLRRAAPYVDIWCPEQDSFYRVWGPTPDMYPEERLAIMRADSPEVWTYECFPRVKRISPLGYYRHQAWLAWQMGLNGLGFWTYCTSPDDPWTPTKDEYLLVYPGRDGPIPSKRWEACRDGVEDYEALWLARRAVEDAVSRGEPGARDARAEIDRLVRTVIEERAVWPVLQEARERIAEITMSLLGPR